jgi:hypothetical protein
MKWKWSLLRKVGGAFFITIGLLVAYYWFYKIAPQRHLMDPQWCDNHSERARWLEEQKDYKRMGSSPDLFFRGDRIGYYGDKQWFLWLVDKMQNAKGFRICGCTKTALALMANQYVESCEEWIKVHGAQTQEEWIKDGFADFGLTVHLPPSPEDLEPLLSVLGRKSWNVLWNGPQDTDVPDAIPDYIQYNAFRWLRDFGFDPTEFVDSNPRALVSAPVAIGLFQYMKWHSQFPRRNGLGILSLGQEPASDVNLYERRLILRSWFPAIVYSLIIIPCLAGCALIIFPRRKKL